MEETIRKTIGKNDETLKRLSQLLMENTSGEAMDIIWGPEIDIVYNEQSMEISRSEWEDQCNQN